MSETPIENLGLLSDCHSAALVNRAGSVEWWCVPRFDSPSVFGRLLDDSAGHFSLHVLGARSTIRRYQSNSLAIVSTTETGDGILEVTDALAMAEGVRTQFPDADAAEVERIVEKRLALSKRIQNAQ